MIRWHRTATPAQGKAREAAQWAGQVAGVVNKVAPEANLQTMVTRYGDLAIHWFVDAPNAGALEAINDKITGDSGYQETLARAQTEGLFFPGSVKTVAYETPRM